MPYKDQSDCYRTIKGEKYINLCDMLEQRDDDALAEIKEKKLRHRVIKHPDGFRQLFIHSDDVQKLS